MATVTMVAPIMVVTSTFQVGTHKQVQVQHNSAHLTIAPHTNTTTITVVIPERLLPVIQRDKGRMRAAVILENKS